jgi:phosphatidylserine/phosphatidylglycerophosphate/cardiolipin synthase-like enzyme
MILVLGILLGAIGYFIFSTMFLAPVIMPIFSPDNGNEIINILNNAEKSIDIEMYVFSSEELLETLKRAHERGVKIRIILEKRVVSDENKKMFNALQSSGIEVRWASKVFTLTHAKFIIVDGKKVVVGSHNFSDRALNFNREASVLLERTNVVEYFKNIFENDWALSEEG